MYGHTYARPTSKQVYAALRRTGSYVLRADEGTLIPAIRRHAAEDGLKVSQYREPGKGLSGNQKRQRAFHVSLTADGMHIVAPDAEVSHA